MKQQLIADFSFLRVLVPALRLRLRSPPTATDKGHSAAGFARYCLTRRCSSSYSPESPSKLPHLQHSVLDCCH